jgi:hypothetical protein
MTSNLLLVRARTSLLVLFIAVIIALPVVSAHVPNFPEGNDTLDTALHIDDPAKSSVVYANLHHHDEAQYYSFHIEQGEKIYLGLLIPINSEEGYVPSFVLMGPGMGQEGEIPPFIEKPEDTGYIVIEGMLPEQGEYEGFSPSAFYELAEININAPAGGEYYVAAYSEEGEGNYALVVGYIESFTIIEFIRVPLDLIVVYQWEGQSLLEILSPFIITVVMGLILMIYGMRKRGLEVPIYGLVGAIAGLFFLGSSVIMLYQMIYALNQVPANSQIIITLLFTLVPLIMGIAIIRIGLMGSRKPSRGIRATMFIIGILALFVWAGYFVGPALAIIAAILPVSIASRIIRI